MKNIKALPIDEQRRWRTDKKGMRAQNFQHSTTALTVMDTHTQYFKVRGVYVKHSNYCL